MSTLVGTLAVDVTNGNATFTLDDAKSQLDKFGKAAKDAGGQVDYSMREARGSLMLVENEVGVHLPREMNTLIASIPGVGQAFAAMLPIVGVVAAIAIVGKLVEKHREAIAEIRAVANAQVEMGTTGANALRGLDDKILGLGSRLDELRGDHVAALKKELQLIDDQSLGELEKTFDVFGKAADAVFAHLKASWYELGSGSVGAKNALDDFKVHYDALLAAGNKQGAADLLAGTLKSAKDWQGIQAQVNSGVAITAEQAKIVGEKYREGALFSQQEVEAQNALVGGLNLQVEAAQKLATANQLAKEIKTTETGNKIESEADAQFKRDADARRKDEEDAERVADKNREALVENLHETEEQRIAVTKSGTQARIAAIDAAIKEETQKFQQGTKFYEDLLKQRIAAVREELAEETKAHEEASRSQETLAIKAATDTFKNESEVQKAVFAQRAEQINAAVAHERTSQGAATAARIALIKDELAAKLAEIQEERDAKQSAILAEIAAEQALADKAGAGGDKAAQIAAQTKVNELTAQYNALTAKGVADQTAAGIAAQTAINKEKDALTDLEKAMQKAQEEFNQSFAKSIVEGKNFGKEMQQVGRQMLEHAIENSMKMIENEIQTNIRMSLAKKMAAAEDQATQTAAAATTKATDESTAAASQLAYAKSAAAKAYNAMAPIPIVGPVLGAVTKLLKMMVDLSGLPFFFANNIFFTQYRSSGKSFDPDTISRSGYGSINSYSKCHFASFRPALLNDQKSLAYGMRGSIFFRSAAKRSLYSGECRTPYT